MPLSHEPAPPERRRRHGHRDADEGKAFEEFWEGPANRDSGVAAPRQAPTRGQPVSGASGGGPTAPGPSTGAYGAGPTAAGPRTGAYPNAPHQGDSYTADAYADDGYDEDYYEDEYDDYEGEEGEELSRRRGCRAVLITFGVLLVAAGVGAWFAWSWAQGEIDPSGEPGETVLVEIPDGASTSDVGHELADAGVHVAIVEGWVDGVGGADAAKGTGLSGLADRVEALDGRLEVESKPAGGTRVRAEIPLG